MRRLSCIFEHRGLMSVGFALWMVCCPFFLWHSGLVVKCVTAASAMLLIGDYQKSTCNGGPTKLELLTTLTFLRTPS